MFSIAWQWIRNLLTHFELQEKTLRTQSQTPKIWQHKKQTNRWLIRNQSFDTDVSETLTIEFRVRIPQAARSFLFSAESLLKWQMEIKKQRHAILLCFNKISICLPATNQKSFIYMSCIGAGLFFFSAWQQRGRVWKPEAYVSNCGFGFVSKSLFKSKTT